MEGVAINTSEEQSDASHGTGSGEPAKARSCATCARRKVRCDKRFPCNRCQSAGVACVLPPRTDPRPRWARRLISASGQQATYREAALTPAGSGSDDVHQRVRLLEQLVHDLSSELEQARANSSTASSRSAPQPSKDALVSVASNEASPHVGRVILDDSERPRYVSGEFWSHIDHELDGLEDTHAKGKGTGSYNNAEAHPSRVGFPSSTSEVPVAVSCSHGLLWRNPSIESVTDLLPLASQMPFLLEVYQERVHSITCIPHMPSFKELLQRRRIARKENAPPSEDALIFAVCYSAVCALDDEEVMESFNQPKSELGSRFNSGLERSLARADFLVNTSYELVEAFVIYLALARQQENLRYVWMMTGLAARMAQYLGIHRDAQGSKHITPFQVEMQRRLWWNITALDMRATEDQGTEPAVPLGSHSAKVPTNVNDADIWPAMQQLPAERDTLTSVSLLRFCSHITITAQEMMAAGTSATVEDQVRRLSSLAQKLEWTYFSLSHGRQDHAYLAAKGFMRIALGRMTLLAFLPVLYSSPSAEFSLELRTKLLVSGIEVAENNHGLNLEPSCLPWRWVYQTQQHWHAVIYLLIEICRRPWAPIVERAWVALQSPWLVPARTTKDKDFSVLIPLRRLMARAREHRTTEILRLRSNPEAAASLAIEDQQVPVPSSSDTFPAYFEPDMFRRRWRGVVALMTTASNATTDEMHSHIPIQHDSSHGAHASHDFSIGAGSAFTESANMSYPVSAPTNSSTGGVSTSEPWLGAMNTSDWTDLSDFLGTNTDVGLTDIMTDADFLNFDWNSWFESAKGVL